jgi:hypothetical protein
MEPRACLSDGIVVPEISLQRGHEFFGCAVFEADAVVHANVVDERVDAAELGERLFDRDAAGLGRVKPYWEKAEALAFGAHDFEVGLDGVAVVVDDDGDGALGGAGVGDRGADAEAASGDEDYFVA